MPLPQPSRKIYEAMTERMKKQEDRLSKIKKMLDAYNLDFWMPFRQLIENRAKLYATNRDENCMSLDEVTTKALWSREQELKWVMGMPEELMGSYKALVEEAAQTKEEAKEYAKRLQNAGI